MPHSKLIAKLSSSSLHYSKLISSLPLVCTDCQTGEPLPYCADYCCRRYLAVHFPIQTDELSSVSCKATIHSLPSATIHILIALPCATIHTLLCATIHIPCATIHIPWKQLLWHVISDATATIWPLWHGVSHNPSNVAKNMPHSGALTPEYPRLRVSGVSHFWILEHKPNNFLSETLRNPRNPKKPWKPWRLVKTIGAS